MVVVSNATPLIYLAAIGRFDLLKSLFGRVCIPNAVFEEVVVQGAGRWGEAETAAANWIDRHSVINVAQVASLETRLHGGESEVVVLSQQLGADLALVDDLAARNELKSRGIAFVGTVGILLNAKSHGLIVEVRPEIDKLIASGFRLADRVIRACLAAAGE